ncbi:MAG: RNA 3'-phosphate cyclase [Bacteroidia bacterium]|nr:RNA 3'-phosphate cyclase [Bacteroidia bacterium]
MALKFSGNPVVIDGSHGEGGGQIVRSSMALSVLTGRPVRVEGIRAGRRVPGLKAQHLTAVLAWQQICKAQTNHVQVGSEVLEFIPGPLKPGQYRVDIGTAGSISLVLQAVLLPLLFAGGPSELIMQGGTCGLWQAPVEYTEHVFFPYLRDFAGLEVNWIHRGYFPKGGGKVAFRIHPNRSVKEALQGGNPLQLAAKGKLLKIGGICHASTALQSKRVAERFMEGALRAAGDLGKMAQIEVVYGETRNPGGGLTLWAEFENPGQDAQHPVIVGADALLEKGKSAEETGQMVMQALKREIESEAVVDEFLSDQLIPLMALRPGSEMRVPLVSEHLRSNIYVCEAFLPTRFTIDEGLVRSYLP